jgi:prepilin-type N-terminal cleavage/methylation domain-containing protein
MLQKSNNRRGGFTLVEIMIVVAIIALLAAIAVPNFLRARKRSQATLILEDLRVWSAAIDQYAIDNGKATGDSVNFPDIQPYLKAGTPLYNTGQDLFKQDIFYFNPGTTTVFGNAVVDSIPCPSPTTFAALSDVAPPSFWSPYYPQ